MRIERGFRGGEIARHPFVIAVEKGEQRARTRAPTMRALPGLIGLADEADPRIRHGRDDIQRNRRGCRRRR